MRLRNFRRLIDADSFIRLVNRRGHLIGNESWIDGVKHQYDDCHVISCRARDFNEIEITLMNDKELLNLHKKKVEDKE